jgi:DNA-binding MarR family transcriptional regulator
MSHQGTSAAPPAMMNRTIAANQSWESLMTAHARIMKRYAAHDMWAEVSMREYDVLYTLSKSSTPLHLSELNQGVVLSQPALSRMVDRLVRRGLVTRVVDSDDRRSVRLSLTEAGADAQRVIGRAHGKDVVEAMESLDDEELQVLRALCLKLIQAQPEVHEMSLAARGTRGVGTFTNL